MNNLSTWLLEEGYAEKNGDKALIWPGSIRIAKQLSENLQYRTAVTSPNINPEPYQEIENVVPCYETSHAFAEHNQINENINLEYGWALASGIANSIENGLTREEAMRKIADTSEDLLEEGGHAIYNLDNIGHHPSLPSNESDYDKKRLEYAETFQNILREDYSDNVVLHEDLEYSSRPHLTWQK